MTGYTVHTGANEKFVAGWDKIFGTSSKKSRKSPAKAVAGRKPAGKVKKRAFKRG